MQVYSFHAKHISTYTEFKNAVLAAGKAFEVKIFKIPDFSKYEVASEFLTDATLFEILVMTKGVVNVRTLLGTLQPLPLDVNTSTFKSVY